LTPDEVWKINGDHEATFLNALKVVDEPSMLERSKDKRVESYRFLWIMSALSRSACGWMFCQTAAAYSSQNTGESLNLAPA